MKARAFDSHPIRTRERSPEGARTKDFSGLAKAPPTPPPNLTEVSEASFVAEVDRLDEANFQMLKSLRSPLLPKGDRVLPKDSSVNPSHMVMAYTPEDSLSLPFIAQMAQVGEVEGFGVLARCAPENLATVREALGSWPSSHNVTLVPSRGLQDVWTEDHGEFTVQGNLVIPPRLDPASPFGVDAILGRLERLYPTLKTEEIAPSLNRYNLEQSLNEWPRANFSWQGAVGESETHLGMLGGAMALQVPASKMAITYVEGGNFLPGTAADATPKAFIGRDSIAISQRALERDLGRKPSEKQVLARLAKDYGLRDHQLHPVEQPADFHVDMAMTWTRPGQILLNDARAALKIQKTWLRRQRDAEIKRSPQEADSIRATYSAEVKRLEVQARHHADLEALSEQDLKAGGVEVHRLAGSFPESLANPPMNFLNLRQGTNEAGEAFAVMLGGTPEAEDYISRQLLETIPSGYQRIHFLDRELTAPTLELWGGIKCRTKPLAIG